MLFESDEELRNLRKAAVAGDADARERLLNKLKSSGLWTPPNEVYAAVAEKLITGLPRKHLFVTSATRLLQGAQRTAHVGKELYGGAHLVIQNFHPSGRTFKKKSSSGGYFCDAACREAMRTDRAHGAIYGPYAKPGGGYYRTAELASAANRNCAYCGEQERTGDTVMSLLIFFPNEAGAIDNVEPLWALHPTYPLVPAVPATQRNSLRAIVRAAMPKDSLEIDGVTAMSVVNTGRLPSKENNMQEHVTSVVRKLLMEADSRTRALLRRATESGDERDWEAYEAALVRDGAATQALISRARRATVADPRSIERLLEMAGDRFYVLLMATTDIQPTLGTWNLLTFRWFRIAGVQLNRAWGDGMLTGSPVMRNMASSWSIWNNLPFRIDALLASRGISQDDAASFRFYITPSYEED